ncbi:MAG: SufE family protein [Thermoleophilia bacterium]|nr:SufE family protein [Thermoleophilia bacterium]
MIPAPLAEIVEDFAASPREMRLQMLLGYAQGLPDLPDRYADQDALERVQECQTPFFLAVEIDDDRRVSLFFDAPPEAPTTRGYAGILAEGLDGATVDEVLATPPDFFTGMGLAELISPLRLRGMSAILAHIKRRVVELSAG